jgi:transposase
MTSNNPSQKRYPTELKQRAVAMVAELQARDPNDHAVVSRVARQLGVGAESLRGWSKQASIDAGRAPGTTSSEHEELVTLRREVKELRRANEILQAAATFFGAELDRRRNK